MQKNKKKEMNCLNGSMNDTVCVNPTVMCSCLL